MRDIRHRDGGRGGVLSASAVVGLVPLLVLAPAPVSAAECLPRAGTFLSGEWTGYGYRDLYAPLDGLHMDASEEGAFSLEVDEGGAVEGELEIVGGGNAASSEVIGASTGAWEVHADLFGSASNVIVRGELTFAVDGVVDLGGRGDDVVGFDYGFDHELDGSFAPLEVDCTMAWGTFDGVGVGDGLAWVATRSGDPATAAEFRTRFTQVVAHAEAVLSEEEPGAAEVDLAVRQLIALNDLIGQATACGEAPDGIQLGSPAAGFARDTLGAVVERFLETALREGAYTTQSVVATTVLALQAGLFDAPECGSDGTAQAYRSRLIALLHDVLAARLSMTSREDQPAEFAALVSAVHQFGMHDIWEKLS
jgi:hypothetical protein